MASSEEAGRAARRERGAEVMKEVYAGDVTVPPAGASDFVDIMLEQVFAEVWSRDQLSLRDRRLLLLGAIAALGEKDVFGIQAKAALKNGELDETQLRETLVQLAQYCGYPRVAGLIAVVEGAIAKHKEEGGKS